MPFCPAVSELRFYVCCHPCFRQTYTDKVKEIKLVKYIEEIVE